MIAIVDYGMGNLQSVANAVEALGVDFEITNEAKKLQDADGIILPGVGAFGDGMKNLCKLKLVDLLREEIIEKKKPYLGICLGLQFLVDKGYEKGEHEGFGWIKGEVKLMEPDDPKIKVPHMGWNNIEIKKDSEIFKGLKEDPVFYFIHSFSFVLDPEEVDIITSTASHGLEIVASLQKGNIFATQFHPEKSQTAGLLVLKNFIDYCDTNSKC
ncbi:imidazole glycerol phosphate synthase subunit HisH [Patescibacteria group bacterium]|nr:imidazole glycerol phosphate synthase subunit HisH [Patescibacteria group bacterium]